MDGGKGKTKPGLPPGNDSGWSREQFPAETGMHHGDGKGWMGMAQPIDKGKGKGQIMEPAPAKGEQRLAGRGEGQTPQEETGKGKGKDEGLDEGDISDEQRFEARLLQAVKKHVPPKPAMANDPLYYFTTTCQNVDNWYQTGSAERSRNWLEYGLRPDAFNPLKPGCPATDTIVSKFWGTQLAAMLRMFYGKPAYAMRQVYMRELVDNIGNPSEDPVRVRISGLPPNLTLFIFKFFFSRLGSPVDLLHAEQVPPTAELDQTVSYVLTLTGQPNIPQQEIQTGVFQHQKLVSLIFSFHLQQVDWPGAAHQLHCQSELLHVKIPFWLKPELQAELHLAAAGIEALTIETLMDLHTQDTQQRHDTFSNDLGLLNPHSWHRKFAADSIWLALEASDLFTLLPGETYENTNDPAAKWWRETLHDWEARGGLRLHPCDPVPVRDKSP